MNDTSIHPGRILAIDDEGPILELLEDILSEVGYTVVTALSGSEAFEVLEQQQFDLVFTDIGMPGMSGWEVCERLRRQRPGLPVVLVTGWGSALSPEETDASGAMAVINKPFQVDELLEKTAQILARRSARPL